MLTVCFRNRATYAEQLREAHWVNFKPRPDGESVAPGLLVGTDDGAEHFGFAEREDDQRDIFVMNEGGQTVARYIL